MLESESFALETEPEGREAYEQELAKLRARIDALDKRLLALLNERTQLSLDAAACKAQQGIERYDEAREAALIARLCMLNGGPLRSEDIERIYGTLLDTMRNVPLDAPTLAVVAPADE